MSKLYEIIIFTASHQKYADPIIDYLDPKRDMISYRLFRDNCYETENGVIKSLIVIHKRFKNYKQRFEIYNFIR